jgi:hypothetical protein
LRNRKGQIRIIEAFFASILILSSLTLIPAGTETTVSDERSLSSKAQEILLTLDNDGYLSKLIENRSWTTLGKCIEAFLSPTIWFNATVLDENGQCLNDAPITSGSPINEKISAADYVCATSSSNFRIYLIRLQLSNVK